MMNDIKANILGTEYKVSIKNRREDAKLTTRDGYTDYSVKKIVVVDVESEKDENSVEDVSTYLKNVMRHETIHALFYESGMDEWASDEQLVDYLAIQIPKICKVWKDLNAL